MRSETALVAALLAAVASANKFMIGARQATDELVSTTTTTSTGQATDGLPSTTTRTRQVTDELESTTTSAPSSRTRTTSTSTRTRSSTSTDPLLSSCRATYTKLLFVGEDPSRPTPPPDVLSWFSEAYPPVTEEREYFPTDTEYWATSSKLCSTGWKTPVPTPTDTAVASQFSSYTSAFDSWRSQVSPTAVAGATQCANVENGWMAKYMLMLLADDPEGCLKAANLQVPPKKGASSSLDARVALAVAVAAAGGVAGAMGLF